VQKHENPVAVVGNRERTDYGYKVAGHESKHFETFFAVIVQGGSTPTWKHATKTRVCRVLNGRVFAIFASEVEGVEDTTKVFQPGDEIVCAAGKPYWLSALSEEVRLSVVQDSKYEARLEVVAPSTSTVEVTEEMLAPLEKEEQENGFVAPPRDRRPSKAAQQIAIQRGQATDLSTRVVEAPRSAYQGINAKPTMGRFSDEDAG
jgi:quercetin dioxygenase-like cupin family protein